MIFTVDPKVWDLFPGMVLAVAVARVDNRTPRPGVAAELDAAAAALPGSWGHENAQSHPNVAAWRDAFRDLGISAKKFPSAIESLARRVLAGKGMMHLNPLVDFYNSVSLRHVVPVGGWDVDGLAGGHLALRLTVGGERFQELGATEVVAAEPGEVSYADDEELVTRHFVWRQSEKAKVTPETERVFLISEVLSSVSPEVAEAVRSSFAEGLRSHFGAEPVTALLRAGSDRWEWPDD